MSLWSYIHEWDMTGSTYNNYIIIYFEKRLIL